MESKVVNSKSLSEVNASVDATQGRGWKKLLAFMGPAYLVSVGYMGIRSFGYC
jgi:manganese transport protein